MFNSPYQMSMRWWEGVVEGRQDPLKIGRVQVRVFGIHTDNLEQLPSSDLHWMQVMMPTTSSSNSGTGETPKLLEGTHVIGFFRDGDSCQDGVVMGSVGGISSKINPNKGFSDQRANIPVGKPKEYELTPNGVVIQSNNKLKYPLKLNTPDSSSLATGLDVDSHHINIVKKLLQASEKNISGSGESKFSEPEVITNTTYPYNDVKETESGHVFEMNDTPGSERVQIAHRTGSFVEMRPEGTVVFKSARDLYNIVHGDSYEHVNKSKNITIEKGVKLLVNASGGESFDIEVGAGGGINITVNSGNVNLEVSGDMSQKISGDYVVEVGGRYKLNATRIDLN